MKATMLSTTEREALDEFIAAVHRRSVVFTFALQGEAAVDPALTDALSGLAFEMEQAAEAIAAVLKRATQVRAPAARRRKTRRRANGKPPLSIVGKPNEKGGA
jgi:hypothetical protein